MPCNNCRICGNSEFGLRTSLPAMRHEEYFMSHNVHSTITTTVNSALEEDVEQKSFYGVCELDSHLSQALSLTQQLRKTLTSLKFLVGPQFPKIEAHMMQLGDIRNDLKRMHDFVMEQQQKTTRMLHNPNEYGGEFKKNVAGSQISSTSCCQCCHLNESGVMEQPEPIKNIRKMEEKMCYRASNCRIVKSRCSG